MGEYIVEAKNLCKYFKAGKNQTLKAVDGVNIQLEKGETLGLVGESGCGKTTCGRTLVKLYDATSGTVMFEGKDVSKLKGKELLGFRKDAQIIFQDPYASLDPRMTIGGTECGVRQPFCPRAVRRPETACGNRESVSGGAEVYRVRRADFSPGRVDTGPDSQPVDKAAKRDGTDVPVYLP